MLAPALVTGVIGEAQMSHCARTETRLVGSGFEKGASVNIEVSHVMSGVDFQVSGVVENLEGDESPQAVVFALPEGLNEQLVEGDSLACKCTAEVSIDGGFKFTSWQTTFTASPMPLNDE